MTTLLAPVIARQRNCNFEAVRSLSRPEDIEGYVAKWGSPDQRDCYGTYFDVNEPPLLDLEFLPLPLRYGHGQDPDVGKGAIGKIVRVWLDDVGIKFRAVLDTAHEFYDRIANEIRDGLLATSSGTNDYLAEFAPDGRFVSWPVSEVSLTDQPCEQTMPSVKAIRSMDSKHLQLEVTPTAPLRQAITQGDPRDCGCDEQANRAPAANSKAPIRKQPMALKKMRAPMPPVAKTPMTDDSGDDTADTVTTKRGGGLTLGMLGLDQNATLSDIWEALSGLVGEGAANAMWGEMTGEDPMDDDPTEEAMLGLDSDRADDPENDNRPLLKSKGSNDPEDISEREGRSANLTSTLTRLLKNQAAQSAPKQRRAPAHDEIAELREQNRLLRQTLLNAETDDRPTPKTDRRSGQQGTTRISDARDLMYDMSSAADLAYAVKVLETAGKRPSDSLVRATSYKIAHEIEKGTPTGSDYTVRHMMPFRSRDDVMKADIKAFRAGEVMGDANANFGSNYVGVFYDTSLWLKVRAMPIWKELEARGMEEKVIPVGYASDVIPLEGADFTWYRVPETVDVDATGRPKINIPASKAGTSSTTLTVRTLGALVYYSVLLEEDSIVPMASELNRKAGVQSQEQIESALFNGDTATGTTNLNYKNGTLSANDVSNFTTVDGMLKAGIYGNSGLNARQSSALNELDFQLLFGLLNNNGITGSDPSKLMFVCDPNTGLAADRLPIFKTMDVYNPATIIAGKVQQVFGVPIYRSGQILLADSTGYIDVVTPANNKFGRIGLIRPDQWVVGFKRSVTMEYFRDVPGQSNGMVITLRLGLQNRDATQAAAATYNVTIK